MAKKTKNVKGEVTERAMVMDDRPLNKSGNRMSNAEWAAYKGKQTAKKLEAETRNA
jgi:hypothetical protein